MTRARTIVAASLIATALAVALASLSDAGTAAAGARSASRADRADAAVTARSASGLAKRVLRLQNAVRRQHGLRRLELSRDLLRAARRHARDMVRHHYFGHVSRGGRDVVDRVARTNYGHGARFAVQENLYWWNRRRLASAVVRAWMSSPVHRANLLNPGFRQFAVAAVMQTPYGGRGVTVVGVYGSRLAR